MSLAAAASDPLAEAQALIAQQREEIGRLRERVSRLERRLGEGKAEVVAAAKEHGLPPPGAAGVVQALASKAEMGAWWPKAAAAVLQDDPCAVSVDQALRVTWLEGTPAGAFWALVLRAVLAGECVAAEALLRGACGTGELAAVRWLVEHGASGDVSTADTHGNTPLHWACGGGHLTTAAWLVAHGAAGDVSRLSSDGATPLHWACRNGHLTTAQWLLEHGAAVDVSRPTYDGNTPLHWACHKGDLALVRWLLEHGAADDESKTNDDGQTPLHRACRQDHFPVVEWLVKHGARARDASRGRWAADETAASASAF